MLCVVCSSGGRTLEEGGIPLTVHTLQECSLSNLLAGGLLRGICLNKT